MHGTALDLLDDLIRAWSRWDEQERYYLEDLAPRIVRSDDPDFRWIDRERRARGGRAQAIERVTLVRLKELMSPEEWLNLPELLRERRGLRLHELESDSERQVRLAGREAAQRDAEQARRDEERQRREAEEWPDAVDRARRDGEERRRRETEQERDRLEAEERDRLEREAGVARRLAQARRAQRNREEQARRKAEEQARREAAAGSGDDDQAPPSSVESVPGAEERPDADASGEKSHATGGRRSRSGDGLIEGDAGGQHRNRTSAVDGRPHGTPGGEGEAMSEEPPDGSGDRSRLRELQSLADEGLITPEEHERLRARPAVRTDLTPPSPGEAGEEEPVSEDPGEQPPDQGDPHVASAADGAARDEDVEEEPAEAAADELPTGEEEPVSEDPGEQPPDQGAPHVASTADSAARDEDGKEKPAEPTANEPPAASEPDAPAGHSADTPSASAGLEGYARRLARAGAQRLAGAVSEYAQRVAGVERGESPPAMSVAPAAITPEMVGAALVRNRFEWLVELVRNVLIFMPVLWTWIKLQSAVSAWDRSEPFFEFWVQEGGDGPLGGIFRWWLGGTLEHAALQVAGVLGLLIAVNVWLGLIRGRAGWAAAREARAFAAVLAQAEAAGAAQRAADPQEALAGFAVAGSELTRELRAVGASLQASAQPFADSLVAVREALDQTSEMAKQQQEQSAAIVERLGRVAQIGDQLAALQRGLAGAEAAAARSADALEGIRAGIEPSARDLAKAASAAERAAERIGALQTAFASSEAASARSADALEGIRGSLEPAAERLDVAASAIELAGGELSALQAAFASVEQATARSAEALEGIGGSLEPSAGKLDDASQQLARLAGQLALLTDAMAGEFSGPDSGIERSAASLELAASRMNTVATRVLDELGDGRGGRR